MTLIWDLNPDAQDMHKFNARYVQGATTTVTNTQYPSDGYPFNTAGPVRHSFVATNEIHTGGFALRTIMPPSGGVTSRYQFRLNRPNIRVGPTGVIDEWYGIVFRLGSDTKMSELGNGGTNFFSSAGPGPRFNNVQLNGAAANGPYGYLATHHLSDNKQHYTVTVNSTGGVENQDASSRGFIDLGLVVFDVWEYFVFHVGWSRTSSGFREVWRNGTNMGRYDGFTVWNGGTTTDGSNQYSIEERLGYYRGSAFTTNSTTDIAWFKHGTVRSDVDPVGTTPPPVKRHEPAPPTQTSAGNQSITLNWTAPSTLLSDDTWNIYVNNILVANVANAIRTYTYSNSSLTNGTSVDVRLEYGKTGDLSLLSDSVSMTPGSITSIYRRPTGTT